MTGQEIREKRKALKYTQKELAAALGVETNTLARWERGEIKPQSVKMLRLAFTGLELERLGSASDYFVPPQLTKEVKKRLKLLQKTKEELLAIIDQE